MCILKSKLKNLSQSYPAEQHEHHHHTTTTIIIIISGPSQQAGLVLGLQREKRKRGDKRGLRKQQTTKGWMHNEGFDKARP